MLSSSPLNDEYPLFISCAKNPKLIKSESIVKPINRTTPLLDRAIEFSLDKLPAGPVPICPTKPAVDSPNASRVINWSNLVCMQLFLTRSAINLEEGHSGKESGDGAYFGKSFQLSSNLINVSNVI